MLKCKTQSGTSTCYVLWYVLSQCSGHDGKPVRETKCDIQVSGGEPSTYVVFLPFSCLALVTWPQYKLTDCSYSPQILGIVQATNNEAFLVFVRRAVRSAESRSRGLLPRSRSCRGWPGRPCRQGGPRPWIRPRQIKNQLKRRPELQSLQQNQSL